MSDDIILYLCSGRGGSLSKLLLLLIGCFFFVSVAIELNPDYVRALLRRAELYEQMEKLDEALEDYKEVLNRDPNHTNARQACMVSSAG